MFMHTEAAPFTIALFLGMILFLELGRRAGLRMQASGAPTGVGTVEGAVFALLFAMGLCSALLAGFGMASNPQRSWLHILGFAAAMGLCVYVIRDIEYPRLGLIRVTATDQVMKDLRASMK